MSQTEELKELRRIRRMLFLIAVMLKSIIKSYLSKSDQDEMESLSSEIKEMTEQFRKTDNV